MKCSSCGASLATSVHTDKRYNRVYRNFQCYKFTKGKCLVSHAISEKKLVPLVLDVLKEDMNKAYIEYEHISTESDNKQDILKVQLKRLESREKRIKEAYLNGVDSLEEYKENKEQINVERDMLLHQADESSEEQEKVDMPGKIRGVYDILRSDEYTKEEKHAAITSIVKKIVFDRENKTLDFYYYTK